MLFRKYVSTGSSNGVLTKCKVGAFKGFLLTTVLSFVLAVLYSPITRNASPVGENKSDVGLKRKTTTTGRKAISDQATERI